MIHSKYLEETALWKKYQEKVIDERERSDWVKEVCEAATIYMKDVRQTFQNYTLHDETHIINVLDAIGGLLGDQISQLTVGEIELLILSASLHDLGMVYTNEDKVRHYNDEEACGKFLREYCPEFLGCSVKDWSEDIRQWYLRTLHPFRIPEILQNKAWRELFARCPKEIVPKRCILAVCKAHGENPETLLHNKDLKYLAANDADPLFCALLLRLGDLLDFDDTRAPKVLYGYVACNEKSRAEWDKHLSSAGFRYPDSPSTNDLPYKACCTNPGVEHAVRDFLDWVDDELGNCIKSQKYCNAVWQQKFAFPKAVLREEIESEGYMSGDFCLTMDQTQVLNLLTGENLYDNRDVFVRELLQNAIDATLLRGKMDNNFVLEQSHIDLWEWNDKEGNIWFRIDDQGTGMTLGMLQRYFLKVGNSYYTSRELDRDLRDHGKTEKYNGISRFGIGFLSCFLCGDYAEVSTLYFDPNKNRREESVAESYQTVHYGLRLQVTGLTGYYTLKNQAANHQADKGMPMPDSCDTMQCCYDRDGYRAKAGTSIAIRLEPGKLGILNLRDAVEKYLCGTRVPVYYNNEPIGHTYEGLMKTAHEMEGERVYEISDRMKAQFDKKFPAVCGQYPKIVMTVVPLDTGEDHVLPGVSGVLTKCEVQFDKVPEWRVKDQKYMVEGTPAILGNSLWILLQSDRVGNDDLTPYAWKSIKKEYGKSAVVLEQEFKKYPVCPHEEQLGDKWLPFVEHLNLYETWRAYLDYQQERFMQFSIEEFENSNMDILFFLNQREPINIVYQGVVAGNINNGFIGNNLNMGVFFLENEWQPVTEVSRLKITRFPLIVLVVIMSILRKYKMMRLYHLESPVLEDCTNYSLKEWRKVRIRDLEQWMDINYGSLLKERMQFLMEPLKVREVDRCYFYLDNHSDYVVLNTYHEAYLQDSYKMIINFEEGQTISFCQKDEEDKGESILDLFPPMMYCKSASDRDSRYICSADSWNRKGINMDHTFVVWLFNNAHLLNKYYQRQFREIIDWLCNYDATIIIQGCNRIRQQLVSLPEHHGVDVKHFPQLSEDDFWNMGDTEDKT